MRKKKYSQLSQCIISLGTELNLNYTEEKNKFDFQNSMS